MEYLRPSALKAWFASADSFFDLLEEAGCNLACLLKAGMTAPMICEKWHRKKHEWKRPRSFLKLGGSWSFHHIHQVQTNGETERRSGSEDSRNCFFGWAERKPRSSTLCKSHPQGCIFILNVLRQLLEKPTRKICAVPTFLCSRTILEPAGTSQK